MASLMFCNPFSLSMFIREIHVCVPIICYSKRQTNKRFISMSTWMVMGRDTNTLEMNFNTSD